MKIVSIDNKSITPVVARAVELEKDKSGKMYYNIAIGTLAKHNKECWRYNLKVRTSLGQPKKITDVLQLNEDNYIIQPILKDNKKTYDKNKNVKYWINIDKSGSTSHKSNYIIILDIPILDYLIDDIILEGYVKKLVSVKKSANYMDSTLLSTVAILITSGDCSITWMGRDSRTDKKVKQTITIKDTIIFSNVVDV